MMKRYIYIGLGLLAVGLGALGVVVPGLPTTPFLLLASWLFYRSSPRLQQWLLASWLGRYIRNYQRRGGMTATQKAGTYNDNDPIGVLDVTILSNLVLDKVLGIKDLRTDKRIDFVGGIRGLGELKRRVDNGEMKVAFALYPVSMKQIIDIADTGNIMPPKTTWFEPKLRSGLVIHELC